MSQLTSCPKQQPPKPPRDDNDHDTNKNMNTSNTQHQDLNSHHNNNNDKTSNQQQQLRGQVATGNDATAADSPHHGEVHREETKPTDSPSSSASPKLHHSTTTTTSTTTTSSSNNTTSTSSSNNTTSTLKSTPIPKHEIIPIHIIHTTEKKTLRVKNLDSSTTIQHLLHLICDKLAIEHHFRYLLALCLILTEKQDQNERDRSVVIGNGRIVEKWLQREDSILQSIYQGNFSNKPRKVFLRIKYYKRLKLERMPQNSTIREIIYKQLHWKVCTSEFACRDFEAVNLAALSLQKQFGDYSGDKFKSGCLRKLILSGEMLPIKNDYMIINKDNLLSWEERLITLWSTKYAHEYTRKRAQKEYIATVMYQIATYGFLFIDDVWIVNARHKSFLMGVAEDGIYLFQRHDYCILKEVYLFEKSPTIQEYFSQESSIKRNCKLYVNKLTEWSVTVRGLKITDGENRQHHFVLGEHRREQIASLLDGYYKLLSQKFNEEAQDDDYAHQLSPIRVSRTLEENASSLLPIDLYDSCSIKLHQFNRFNRQLSFIRATYSQKCEYSEELHKFSHSLNIGLDLGTPLEFLDLRVKSMTDGQFQNIVNSIVDSEIYCEKHTVVKRDLRITKLKIAADNLTHNAIPYITDLVEYCPHLKDISIVNFRHLGKNVGRIAGALSQLKHLGHLELENCNVDEMQEQTLSHNLINVLIDVQ